MKLIVYAAIGGLIGLISVIIGYGADTWQFWAFTVPLSGFLGGMTSVILDWQERVR